MEGRNRNKGAHVFLIALLVMVFGPIPVAHSLGQPSVDSLQAAMRTLSFIDSLPKEGTLVVGVVYPSDVPDVKALAVETAKVIGTIGGQNSRKLQPIVLSDTEMARYDGHLDFVFLVAGVSKHPATILSAIHRLHLVSISDDPLCLEAKCCVLFVRAGQRVEISLNTALADDVGARFSLVFAMVVKRK